MGASAELVVLLEVEVEVEVEEVIVVEVSVVEVVVEVEVDVDVEVCVCDPVAAASCVSCPRMFFSGSIDSRSYPMGAQLLNKPNAALYCSLSAV